LGWVASCAERPTNVPPGVRAWASGNEPAWAFSMDAKAAMFRTLDDVLSFPVAALKPDISPSVYEANDSVRRLRVEFTDELCSDTMTEAAFGRRVVAAVNGALYTGCGLVR
jgi:putative lipoprotein